ncbi:MAG: hypothetical protein H0W15_00575 [Gemmatimonadales bacterium]|nr:hypothetical protein [Gemmatimonadales bacterium]
MRFRITLLLLAPLVFGCAQAPNRGSAIPIADVRAQSAHLAPPPLAPIAAVVLPASALARFAGEYRSATDPLERIRFEIRDGAPGFAHAGGFDPVVPVGPRTFRLGPLAFEFTEPVFGTPTRFTFERGGRLATYIQSPTPWRPTMRELAAFEGLYRSEELDVEWTFALRDGRLEVHRKHFPEQALAPDEHDVLRLIDVFEDETLTRLLAFARDAAGTVTGFRLTTDGVADLGFARSR